MMDFSNLPKIVAVDFDGYLVEDKFPNVGEPKAFEIALVKALYEMGVRTILWTSRTDEHLGLAVKACESFGLMFDAINTNIEEVKALTGKDTRKVYANVYLDDHAGVLSIRQIARHLELDPNTLTAEHDLYFTQIVKYVSDCSCEGVSFEYCMNHLKEAFHAERRRNRSKRTEIS